MARSGILLFAATALVAITFQQGEFKHAPLFNFNALGINRPFNNRNVFGDDLWEVT